MNNTSSNDLCISTSEGDISIIFVLLIAPFHFFVLLTLFRRIKEKLPRHKFLISLSISDSTQVIVTGLLANTMRALHLRTASTVCKMLHLILQFNTAMTIVSASSNIVALSIERYIACVYCLRMHSIMTKTRVQRAIISIWAVSIVCGCIALNPAAPNLYPTAVQENKRPAIEFALMVFASSVILLVIQIRLYKLSRDRRKVLPGQVCNVAAFTDTRRQQLRTTLVTSAVVVLYMLCMLPISFFICFSMVTGQGSNLLNVRSVLIWIAMSNTIADPFVYGFGMRDTRKELLKELNRIRTWFRRIVDKDHQTGQHQLNSTAPRLTLM